MNLSSLLRQFRLESLKINAGFLEAEIGFQKADRMAAWELYVELLTRITTQALPHEDGDEATALTSIHSLFATTRDVIKRHGPACITFSKIAVVVLNQVIRPFTARWHKLSLAGAFANPTQCALFRQELATLQIQLRHYTQLIAEIAGVEDLSDLETP